MHAMHRWCFWRSMTGMRMQLKATRLRKVWCAQHSCPAGPCLACVGILYICKPSTEFPLPMLCCAVGAESAIVIEDLPFEEDGDSGEDGRAAAYQEEIADMAVKAKAEERAR